MITVVSKRLLRPEDVADLEALLEVSRRYPGSYNRERVMENADAILDRALDGKAPWACVVCMDAGCEYCPAA